MNMAFVFIGLDFRNWVCGNPAYFRPYEAISRLGDSATAKRIICWQAHKPFEDIVNEMLAAEIRQLKWN